MVIPSVTMKIVLRYEGSHDYSVGYNESGIPVGHHEYSVGHNESRISVGK